MDCGKITTGFVGGACGKLAIGGTGPRILLINHSDIVSYDKEDDGTISDITLKTGAKGYLYETIENANQGDATFSRGTYMHMYDHQVTMRVFKDNIAARAWVNQFNDARVVAIVERRENGEAHWEVYGIESGLKMSENTYTTAYTDNVVMAPVIASDDTSKEMELPAIFYDGTSAASTTEKVIAYAA